MPDSVWVRISPRHSHGGLLCLNCCDNLARDIELPIIWEGKLEPRTDYERFDSSSTENRRLLRREELALGFEQTRERCAKVLDEMAEKAKHEAAGRDDTESVIVVLEIAAARIRALPEEVGDSDGR